MKTKLRSFILLLAVTFSTGAFAQQLDYPAIFQELQNAQVSISQDVAAIQVTIQEQQDVLAGIDAQIADLVSNTGGSSPELDKLRQDQVDVITALQATLAQYQTELANIQLKIAEYTEHRNTHDKTWVMQNNPPIIYNPAAPVSNSPSPGGRITGVPNPSIPSSMNAFFQTTGTAAGDEKLVHDWLLQYGLVDN